MTTAPVSATVPLDATVMNAEFARAFKPRVRGSRCGDEAGIVTVALRPGGFFAAGTLKH